MAVNYPRILRSLLSERQALDSVVRRFLPRALGKCPECGSASVYPSGLKGQYEKYVLPLQFRRPFRCKDCGGRHYNFAFEWISVKRIMQAMAVLGFVALVAYVILQIFEAGPPSNPSDDALRQATKIWSV
jgi:hypothetical protein